MQRKAAAAALFNQVGKGPTGVIKSVLDTQRTDGGRRDEIFVDIVERISCTFNQTGYVTASQIDGAIQVQRRLQVLLLEHCTSAVHDAFSHIASSSAN